MKEKENFELASKILFFGTLEESFAIESAKKFAKAETAEELLLGVHKLLLSRRSKIATRVYMTQGSFVFPAGVDLSYWREFKTHCPQDIFSLILYKWIGGFSDQDICRALKLSKGSLYSRYNQGLMALGEFVVNNQASLGI